MGNRLKRDLQDDWDLQNERVLVGVAQTFSLRAEMPTCIRFQQIA